MDEFAKKAGKIAKAMYHAATNPDQYQNPPNQATGVVNQPHQGNYKPQGTSHLSPHFSGHSFQSSPSPTGSISNGNPQPRPHSQAASNSSYPTVTTPAPYGNISYEANTLNQPNTQVPNPFSAQSQQLPAWAPVAVAHPQWPSQNQSATVSPLQPTANHGNYPIPSVSPINPSVTSFPPPPPLPPPPPYTPRPNVVSPSPSNPTPLVNGPQPQDSGIVKTTTISPPHNLSLSPPPLPPRQHELNQQHPLSPTLQIPVLPSVSPVTNSVSPVQPVISNPQHGYHYGADYGLRPTVSPMVLNEQQAYKPPVPQNITEPSNGAIELPTISEPSTAAPTPSNTSPAIAAKPKPNYFTEPASGAIELPAEFPIGHPNAVYDSVEDSFLLTSTSASTNVQQPKPVHPNQSPAATAQTIAEMTPPSPAPVQQGSHLAPLSVQQQQKQQQQPMMHGLIPYHQPVDPQSYPPEPQQPQQQQQKQKQQGYTAYSSQNHSQNQSHNYPGQPQAPRYKPYSPPQMNQQQRLSPGPPQPGQKYTAYHGEAS